MAPNFLMHYTPLLLGNIKVALSQDTQVNAVVSSSLTFYILSIIVFYLLWYLCGWCCQKQKLSQNTAQVSRACKANRQIYPPPLHPSPVYEQVQPTRAKKDDGCEHLLDDVMPHDMSENQAYSTSPKCPAPVYEDVLSVHGEARKIAEIELKDLKMKDNVSYGPMWCETYLWLL